MVDVLKSLTPPVIILLAGVLLILLAILRNVETAQGSLRLTRKQAMAVGVLGGGLLVLGIIGSFWASVPPPPPTPIPTSTVTLGPTATATPPSPATAVPAPTDLPTLPSLTPTSTAMPCVPLTIDAMDSTRGWMAYLGPSEQSHWTRPAEALVTVPEQNGNALKLDFEVAAGGWVGMAKSVLPGTLPSTTGIQFAYLSDNLKTLELKLFEAGEILCDVDIDTSYGIGAWRIEQIPYTDLKCSNKLPLDPAKVIRIDFAISLRRYGEPGKGLVIIDEIRSLCP